MSKPLDFSYPVLPILLIACSLFPTLQVHAGEDANKDPSGAFTDFFERKIRPVLVAHCYECHSADSDVIQGGLRVDHPRAMVQGGDTGAAIVAGQPEQSLLLAALRYENIEMPPAGQLDKQVIKDFEHWIESGAFDPRPSQPLAAAVPAPGIDWQSAESFWAFQPPQPSQPSAAAAARTGNKIDGFILDGLLAAGVQPNPEAERHELIRRLTFDLIGLPPHPDEVQRFVQDDSPGAVERVVDRLLSDPRAGERWARLWLDVSRYAEDQAHVVGNNDSLTYPNAFYYRDWVIAALAADMPYDEFVRDQLAADVLHPEDPAAHVALGFLGLGPKYYRRGDLTVMADEWEDRVDTVTRGLLALTVACARCHDHKFDPIPSSDYYALAGVFAGTEMFNRPLDETVEQKNGQASKPQDAVHIVREGAPRDLNVMIRGDVNNQGPLAPRGFLTVLNRDGEPQRFDRGSGRVDLAGAIVDPQNPLTARVIVNRVWGQLMGTALVRTQSNFGALGEPPTHPQLLDDLSVRFMQQGWSLKWLQRQIVLSATYRRSSYIDPAKVALDPENRLRWRMPRRRLSAEAYRDALLSVAGQLDSCLGGPSIKPDDADSHRRTIYSKISRLDLNPMLARFDFPDPNVHSPGRYETTTPLQKLFLLNSPFLVRQADSLADRLADKSGSSRDKIHTVYQLLFARMATEEELRLGESFLATDDRSVWTQYLQALLISNEMFVID